MSTVRVIDLNSPFVHLQEKREVAIGKNQSKTKQNKTMRKHESRDSTSGSMEHSFQKSQYNIVKKIRDFYSKFIHRR